ncbi:MSCRAMM family protein [Clostridium grantii]|uniref:Ig-like domain (Group 1) n=1 Tax=Clostridium grantii DSM 8605 TaxID=1121316 RepID=A0A1M5VVM2_9CLOT|nr:carboxypeptidase-like regulatory domain-containing protein [Clostridium grantii]SHH78983.1 Ig-like domain (group 1) [Clostridium grantii DSM 8605]
MSDLYKLGQSVPGDIKSVGEEIKLDVQLEENPQLETGTVKGTISDAEGPIEGVLIKIMDSEHNPLYHDVSKADGTYTISEIAPGSSYHFYAIKDGYLLKEETNFTIAKGQIIVKNSTLEVDPAAAYSTITAHVKDEEGNPIEDLTATLIKMESAVEIPKETTLTNEYGQFIFTNVEQGDYIVRTVKQGYVTTNIEVKISKDSTIVNLEEVVPTSPVESLGTVNGIITDSNGATVAGAGVILYKVSGTDTNPIYTPIKYTKTSDSGVYLFGEVPKGKYIIKSNKEA